MADIYKLDLLKRLCIRMEAVNAGVNDQPVQEFERNVVWLEGVLRDMRRRQVDRGTIEKFERAFGICKEMLNFLVEQVQFNADLRRINDILQKR